MKTKFYIALALSAVLLAASCSSGSDSESGTSTYAPETISDTTAAVLSETATTTSAPSGNVEEETSLVVPFTAANGSGTVAVFGDGSPVVAWFGGLPGEVSLDLLDADVGDAVSVVEELVSFWFFQDDDSGDVPPSILVSAGGDISDSVGTRYVVEAQLLPPAPGTATTTATTSTTSAATTSTTSSVPETSETAASAATTTTTTTSAAPTTTTTTTTTTTVPVVEDLSPAELAVRVLNGSGVAGAAGRLSDSLEDAGYIVLPAGNAPSRVGSSVVYFVAAAHRDEAELVAEAVAESVDGTDDVAVASLPASGEIQPGAANVVVVIGADDIGSGLRAAQASSGLRPKPRSDVALPLPASTPRDSYVPGLANIQIFSQTNDNSDSGEVLGAMNALSGWLNAAGRYSPLNSGQIFVAREKCDWSPRIVDGELQTADDPRYCTVMDREYLETQVWPNIERTFEYFGFTPQNVCGTPQGYSFTDLLQPTRELSEETDYYTGDAIFTTDRLIELYGGTRINPQSNLDFYIRQAVQTAHDMLRLPELLDETEAPQLVLCAAWLAPSGEIPEFSNAAWYALLTPGIQPQERLLSQGTYHVKEISRNGNFAYLVVCHPTIGARFVALHWRDAGYRAEIVEDIRTSGCQVAFEEYDDYFAGITPDGFGNYFAEDTLSFSFGERVFSASDLLGFPRS